MGGHVVVQLPSYGGVGSLVCEGEVAAGKIHELL